MYIVYEAFNLKEQKSYIGVTSNTIGKRKTWHYSNAKKRIKNNFFNALNRTEKNDWIWLNLFETDTKEIAYKKEKEITLIRKANTGVYNEKIGNDPWNKGKEMTEKYKENLKGENNPMFGKTHTVEVRNKLSERMKKCQNGKNNHSARKVIRISDGKTWDTIVECSLETGINKASIQKCCSGKNKTAYGFVFKYFD